MIGRTFSHYQILERLGAGGMGVVYRAHDAHLERDVALKVLSRDLLADDDATRRFRREALVLSRLHHAHINVVHDFDVQDGEPFLVMELVPGTTLAERLRAGPLSEIEAVGIGLQVAHALAAAHEAGVLHRDIKPANIMVTPRGEAKVMDFGLARRFGAVGAQSTALTVGFAGTPAYMAPELLRGGSPSVQTDLYALGVTLYEMVVGRRPHCETNDFALLNAIMNEEPPTPRALRPEISPGLEAVLLRCMARDPAARFSSAGELALALEAPEALSSAETISMRPRTAVSRPAPTPARHRRHAWSLAASLGAALLALAAILGFDLGGLRTRLASAPSIRSIAVLPLENLSRDPEQEYFADGVTEELITAIARIGALRVIARSSVMPFKGTKKPMAQIGRELHVDALVTGSVQRNANRVRIAAQLVRPQTGKPLWADSFDGTVQDLLVLQGQVAQAVAQNVRARLSEGERERFAQTRAVSAEAHDLYLKGRYFADHFLSGNEKRAISYYQQALDRDPTYAPAYAGLAAIYYDLSDLTLAPLQAMPLSRAYALKALELDSTLAEAHVSLGVAKMVYEWDWAGAARELRRGIELAPGDALAHLRLGQYFTYTHHTEEARTEFARVLELDPITSQNVVTATWPDYFAYPAERRPERILRRLADFSAVDSTFGPAWLMKIQAQYVKGDLNGALATLGHLDPDHAHPVPLGFFGVVLAGLGRRAEARLVSGALIRRSSEEFVSPYSIAAIEAAVGDNDEAFRWLEKACQEKTEQLIYLDVDPLFDRLRPNPRFAELMRRIHLSPQPPS